MIRHTVRLPARALVVVAGIALASSGPASAQAEPLVSPNAAEGFLTTLSPDGLGAGDAPVCRLDAPAPRSARIDTAAGIAQIQALIAAEAAAAGAEGEFVAISNRGYNYQPDTLVDPALIEFEARHQGR